MPGLTLLCHGCRGSSPVAGPAFDRFGGLTTCYEILHLPDHRLLIDAGTGIHHHLASLNGSGPPHYTLFLTHLHWDHIQGVPFFTPLYNGEVTIDVIGGSTQGSVEEIIEGVMQPPWFPVSFRGSASLKRFTASASVDRVDDLRVSSASLQHPSGVTGYRFERGSRTLVIATDVEAGQPESDRGVRRLARGADVLVHDAQYLPEEYRRDKVGWGHSTWEHAVQVAADAGVGRLILTSHDPIRTDAEVDDIVAAAREVFPETEAAYSGMRIEV